MKKKNNLIKFVIAALILSAIALLIYATEGNFCGTTTPCSCGANCQGSKDESSNGYNTIDSCSDGRVATYEYVHDIFIEDLNRSLYVAGDTVNVTGTFYCASDGDYIAIKYHNGTTWKHIGDDICYSGLKNYSYTFTLDSFAGNHSVRAMLHWSGSNVYGCLEANDCAYTCDDTYSDTDDIKFSVMTISTQAPSVVPLAPSAGAVYELSGSLKVLISANATDSDGVTAVYANVTWSSGSNLLNLSYANNIYQGNFTNISQLGRYNVTFLAYDAYSNLNSTETTYFTINHTSNITILSPSDGSVYNNATVALNFTVYDNLPMDSVWYSYNNANYSANFSVYVKNNNSFSESNYLETNISTNLSQSFETGLLNFGVYKVSIPLKRIGNGTINATLKLYEDASDAPTGNPLAYGRINNSEISNSSFAWITVVLNSSVIITEETSYWIVLEPNGTNENHLDWAANDDEYPLGLALQNSDKDLLFLIYDKHRYKTYISTQEGSQSLTVYANNSLGAVQYKTASFTIDTVAPHLINVTLTNSTIELGQTQTVTFYANDSTTSVNSAMIERDGQNYSMTAVGNNGFNYSWIPGTAGAINFTIYYNDSAGNRNQTNLNTFTVQATRAPSIMNISYSPIDADVLDPYVNITVQANITCLSPIAIAVLQYKQDNASSWNEKNMTNSSSIYSGNFTPNAAGNWVFRIVANDTFGNQNISANTTINISYDNSWTYTPISFTTKNGAVSTTIEFANLTINNTGDYNQSFNITPLSSSITFALNQTFPITLAPGSIEKISINATLPMTAATYDIAMKIDALNLSASNYSNGTIIAYQSGPYIYAEIIEYSSSVTQGTRINNMTVKITNFGNDTANNVTAVWTLPSGITSRDNTTAIYSTLSVGESRIFYISGDVSSSATTGSAILSFKANCSEGSTHTISKTITINAPPSSTPGGTTTTGGGGGGSGGSTTTVTQQIVINASANPYSLSIKLPEKIEIAKGNKKGFSVELLNNASNTVLENLEISVEGFTKSKISIKPSRISVLEFAARKNITIEIEVPGYTREGEYRLTLKAYASNAGQSFERDFMLVVIPSPSASTATCLIEINSSINKLKVQGLNVAKLEELYDSAQGAAIREDYGQLQSLCSELYEQIKYAETIPKELSLITGRISQLSGEGYDISRAREALDSTNEALSRGDFAKAASRLEQAKLISALESGLQDTLARRIINFVKNNLIVIGLALILTVIFANASLIILEGKRISSQLSHLDKEEVIVMDLIKEAQRQHFEEKIMSDNLYQKTISLYRKRLAKIKTKRLVLELKEINANHGYSKKEMLEKLMWLVEGLQDDYYNKKILDSASYRIILKEYQEQIASLEGKMIAKPDKREVKEINPAKKEVKPAEKEIKAEEKPAISARQPELISNAPEKELKQKPLVSLNQPEITSNTPAKELLLPSPSNIDGAKLAPEDNAFIFPDGRKLRTIQELINALPDMPDEVFSHHITDEKNDFANWIRDVFNKKELAEKIRVCRTKETLKIYLEAFNE